MREREGKGEHGSPRVWAASPQWDACSSPGKKGVHTAQAARGSEQGQPSLPSAWDEGSKDVMTEARPPEMTKWDNLPEAGTVPPAEVKGLRAKKTGIGQKKGRA